MSNYRRLISYIYAYEGEIKGKNIGFAKIEARNGQCKISVSVKKVYVGSSDIGVYLLSEKGEIPLGKVFIRGGTGEFRTSVSVGNVEKTGLTMDQCYGLTLHSTEDTWQSYTTIWEDTALRKIKESTKSMEMDSSELITHAAQLPSAEKTFIRNAPETSDAVEQAAVVILDEVTAEKQEEKQEVLPDTTVPEQQDDSFVLHHRSSIVEEIEAEIQAQEEQQAEPEPQTEPEQREMQLQPEPQPEEHPEEEQQPELMKDKGILERLEQEEAEENQAGRLWQYFRKKYPKIQAFDYEGECEILTIKPQDIGLLPRETWTFGNNSFLLHGYYNYRHLILVKLDNRQGRQRYLLGVPGHYYSNEKYMAGMFGFSNFVLSKMQPAGDGRFGYWYTDIRLGNQ